MARTYVYAVIDSASEDIWGAPGIGGASPVCTLAFDGLGCVVSDYSGEDLGALPKEELVRCLLGHQQVVEHVMRERTVLPVKFGTVLNDTREALDLLSQGRSRFADALASIQDKVEVEVAATWDVGQVLKEISKDKEVVQAREAIGSKGPPTVEDQVRLGQKVKTCMDRRRESHRERMMTFLEPLWVDVADNAMVSDQMVMNVAFLVDRSRESELNAAIEQLDGLFGNELNFRVISPLPPYSFSTVEVTRLAATQVEDAKQVLHLEDDAITKETVRRAYRRLAAQEQRNHRSGANASDNRSASLRQASELLFLYCRVRREAHRDEACHGLPRRDVASLFSIDIKGTKSNGTGPIHFGAAAPMAQGGHDG